MVPLKIVARQRDVIIGHGRIPLQHFTVGTDHVANTPLEAHQGSLGIRQAGTSSPR